MKIREYREWIVELLDRIEAEHGDLTVVANHRGGKLSDSEHMAHRFSVEVTEYVPEDNELRKKYGRIEERVLIIAGY